MLNKIKEKRSHDENRHRSEPSKRQRLSNGLNNHSNLNGSAHSDENDLQKQRRLLPIFPVRWKLIQEIRKYSAVIIIGETGSGKTTQLPQFLHETGMHRTGMIGITQPRRVAAVTIAGRVAKEMNSVIGETVGYSVRFEDMTSSDTKIKFLTDGMLLREAMLDPLLKRYSVIILDEAHERTLHTDVLFGIVKSAQAERKRTNVNPLKIIVMSATMDVDHFSSYFNNAPVLFVEGRQFPVRVMYTKELQDDYTFSVLVTIFQIHQSAPPQHDILVFLTGQDEIESVAKNVRHIAKSLPNDCPTLKVCTLYAALPTTVQIAAFQPTPNGCRKVILSTNIAETSITVSGIKFVIDCGMVKHRSFDPNSSLDTLKVQPISKAQAWQRSGRAGRECSGTVYRTYTEVQYEKFSEFSVPEIQRCCLAGVVLELMAMGINDLLNFDFMDKPSTENMVAALDQLQLLGAVENKDQWELTSCGKQMSSFPVDPRFSKILLASKDFNCTEEVLTIVAVMSVENIVLTPYAKAEEASAARQKFLSNEGDHLTLLNIFKAFSSAGEQKHWCHENYLHHRNLQIAGDIRRQLMEICIKNEIPIRSCGSDTVILRKCLTAGLFMNAAELQKDNTYLRLDTRKPVFIHPTSVLFHTKPEIVIFTELVQTAKCYMRNISVVESDWLIDTNPSYFKSGKLTKQT
ncbi:Putative ATP-dependent RNA helicase dhx33 [Chamberlinius hualienensis]